MLVLAASPAIARPDQRPALEAYVEARAAAAEGALGQASAGFAAALAAEPANALIAAQALPNAILAGEWPLALDSARLLEGAGELPPEGRFLLLADAFRRSDWAAARSQIEAVEREEMFGFLVPVLRAWAALGAGGGDPLAGLPAGSGGEDPTILYAAAHRPLLQIAAGSREGARALPKVAAQDPQGERLRLLAAAWLSAAGEHEAALGLLDGDGPAVLAARRLIGARRPLPVGASLPAAGLAELYARLAFDLHRHQLTPLGLLVARLGTFLAPEQGQNWLLAAELFGVQERQDSGLALLANVGSDDPFAEAALDLRVGLLSSKGDLDGALAVARQAVAKPSPGTTDWLRLGELYGRTGRHSEAAAAYERALAARGSRNGALPEWLFWLLRGGALDQAGDWPAARTALREAHRLAPDQAMVLNYLGYAQLERRENMEEAERLIREAHRLAPDNAAIADSLGWAYYLRGDLPRAIALLEQAAEGEPADATINEHLGDAYYSAGRRLHARFAWRAALVYAGEEDSARLRAKIETGLTPQLAAR